ncbi:ABC transporter ATP-binding protein [Mesorhizobium sp. Z1-4]|uniref:ABC transporter ATP-binding protein n=1 Tax=Mesorhizobium sp. Z1-4 TaxID=2448478 RepID=UPI000FDAD75F|nr:ABC transporter ATP-binding protein [Mesorhizobium sp. Z1-4]
MTLIIDRLNVSYGSRQVLHDVSTRVLEPGSFIGLIGPNAAGKSTLFKALAGLIRPRAGTMELNGKSLDALPRAERARQVVYMPQAYGCNAALTVFESVLLALKQKGGWRVGAEQVERVSGALHKLALANLADRPIGALSGGQAQMVAVAQSLVRAPNLMLLDEPTSALDLHHQLSILTRIHDAARDGGMVVIAALHDLNLAAKFCNRLVLLRDGRVVAEGPTREVLALPAIGETYRVETSLETSRSGNPYVDARLPRQNAMRAVA